MIKGYTDFYYNVSDMNRAVAFYQALGMTKTHGDEYWTSMTLGNLQLGLHGTEGTAVPLTPRDEHGPHNGGVLTFHSDNIPADKELVKKAGGKVLGEMDAHWGHLLIFEDLDGNVMKLMNPKY